MTFEDIGLPAPKLSSRWARRTHPPLDSGTKVVALRPVLLPEVKLITFAASLKTIV